MALNLVKLCVGVDRPAELAAWQEDRMRAQSEAGRAAELVHVTRSTPRRRAEVLDGGSLYWVIKRRIQLRQRILDLREVVGRDGIVRCGIVLDRQLMLTRPFPHIPFQGWRYLKAEDAPEDIGPFCPDEEASLPHELRAELHALGLW